MNSFCCKECSFLGEERCGDILCGHHNELIAYKKGRADERNSIITEYENAKRLDDIANENGNLME